MSDNKATNDDFYKINGQGQLEQSKAGEKPRAKETPPHENPQKSDKVGGANVGFQPIKREEKVTENLMDRLKWAARDISHSDHRLFGYGHIPSRLEISRPKKEATNLDAGGSSNDNEPFDPAKFHKNNGSQNFWCVAAVIAKGNHRIDPYFQLTTDQQSSYLHYIFNNHLDEITQSPDGSILSSPHFYQEAKEIGNPVEQGKYIQRPPPSSGD